MARCPGNGKIQTWFAERKKKKKNDFHVAKQGEGREAIAEEEGMEEGKRSRKVLSLAADSATSDEAAPRCFE